MSTSLAVNTPLIWPNAECQVLLHCWVFFVIENQHSPNCKIMLVYIYNIYYKEKILIDNWHRWLLGYKTCFTKKYLVVGEVLWLLEGSNKLKCFTGPLTVVSRINDAKYTLVLLFSLSSLSLGILAPRIPCWHQWQVLQLSLTTVAHLHWIVVTCYSLHDLQYYCQGLIPGQFLCFNKYTLIQFGKSHSRPIALDATMQKINCIFSAGKGVYSRSGKCTATHSSAGQAAVFLSRCVLLVVTVSQLTSAAHRFFITPLVCLHICFKTSFWARP